MLNIQFYFDFKILSIGNYFNSQSLFHGKSILRVAVVTWHKFNMRNRVQCSLQEIGFESGFHGFESWLQHFSAVASYL